MKDNERPTCPKCGSSSNMVNHGGEWVCHSTHPIERPTPITDAHMKTLHMSWDFFDYETERKMRDLERELAETKERLARVTAQSDVYAERLGHVSSELAVCMYELNELRLDNSDTTI